MRLHICGILGREDPGCEMLVAAPVILETHFFSPSPLLHNPQPQFCKLRSNQETSLQVFNPSFTKLPFCTNSHLFSSPFAIWLTTPMAGKMTQVKKLRPRGVKGLN